MAALSRLLDSDFDKKTDSIFSQITDHDSDEQSDSEISQLTDYEFGPASDYKFVAPTDDDFLQKVGNFNFFRPRENKCELSGGTFFDIEPLKVCHERVSGRTYWVYHQLKPQNMRKHGYHYRRPHWDDSHIGRGI